MRRAGLWGGFLAALDDLATALEDDPPPIDYSARRWAAADPQRLSRATATTRAASASDAALAEADDTLATRTWQTYTGGDARYHPDLSIARAAAAQQPAKATSAALELRLTRRAAAVLHSLAGWPDYGPLEWRPP